MAGNQDRFFSSAGLIELLCKKPTTLHFDEKHVSLKDFNSTFAVFLMSTQNAAVQTM